MINTTQYVWIPENNTGIHAFYSSSLPTVLRKVLNPNATFGLANLPAGRIRFTILNSLDDSAIFDELSLYRTVANKNLTDEGFTAYMLEAGVTGPIDFIRVPGKGFILSTSELDGQDTWLYRNSHFIRATPRVSSKFVHNLAENIKPFCSHSRTFMVADDNCESLRQTSINPDDICKIIRYFQQGIHYWYKVTSIDSVVHIMPTTPPRIRAEEPTCPNAPERYNVRSRIATTQRMWRVRMPSGEQFITKTSNPIIVRILASFYLVVRFQYANRVNEKHLACLRKSKENIENTLEPAKLEAYYQTLYQQWNQSLRSHYDIIGQLHWLRDESITEINTIDDNLIVV
jgi:hypothetical protein